MGLDCDAITIIGIRYSTDEFYDLFYNKLTQEYNESCECKNIDLTHNFCGNCGKKIKIKITMQYKFSGIISENQFRYDESLNGKISNEYYLYITDNDNFIYLVLGLSKKEGPRNFDETDIRTINFNDNLLENIEIFKNRTKELGLFKEESFGIHTTIEYSY